MDGGLCFRILIIKLIYYLFIYLLQSTLAVSKSPRSLMLLVAVANKVLTGSVPLIFGAGRWTVESPSKKFQDKAPGVTATMFAEGLPSTNNFKETDGVKLSVAPSGVVLVGSIFEAEESLIKALSAVYFILNYIFSINKTSLE